MKKQKWFLLFTVFLVLGLILGACQPGATQEAVEQVEEAVTEAAPEIEEAATEVAEAVEEVATEVPAEEPEPTEEPMEEEAAAEGELQSVSADSCDYGGKILSIEAVDELTVVFTLCSPDPAFLAKAAFTPFGIQPAEWIAETGGTGEILEHPIGTGPYMVQEWVRGDSVIYTRFDDYWGDPAIAETAVLRWATEGAARLLELQSGNVHYITNISPDDYEAVTSDPNLQLIEVVNPNVFYLAMTNTFEPFNDPMVRQAIAMGIDRQRLVDNFYPEGSEVPTHFTPCSIANGCQGEPWY
ncbi:MAG TPA: ABC transporter substrate-binding protein, partial [Anaerolineae bacterium]